MVPIDGQIVLVSCLGASSIGFSSRFVFWKTGLVGFHDTCWFVPMLGHAAMVT